jgi:NADH:ubiquinone oxidoreductase subunit 5 (subunit L)/multisubunit Na+/H+ antiporter MnhA subunit
MIEKYISIFLPVALMVFILWSIGRFFSKRKPKSKSQRSIDELRKEFMKYDLLLLLLFFVLTPIFTYLFYNIFGTISEIRFDRLKEDGILILPTKIMWFVPSILFGLGLSAFAVLIIQRPLFKEKHNEYSAYSSMKYGFDAEMVSKNLIKFLVILGTGFFVLAINNYTHFGKDKILISSFFQLIESNYEYEDVVAIKSVEKIVAPNGNIVEDKHFVIDFADNNNWSSRQGGVSFYEKDRETINFVLAKTGFELIHLEFDS